MPPLPEPRVATQRCRKQGIKMEPIDHWGCLTLDRSDYEVQGMCHKLTSSQYVLLMLIINVIFPREKKAVKLMKNRDEHLYSQPYMHRYAQMQFSVWVGGKRGHIVPSQCAWVIVSSCFRSLSFTYSELVEEYRSKMEERILWIEHNEFESNAILTWLQRTTVNDPPPNAFK